MDQLPGSPWWPAGKAFTGVYQSKRGWIEAAEGDTLFLDEIAELHDLL
jgi:transcriptional regulator with AAA-type ATPase domain